MVCSIATMGAKSRRYFLRLLRYYSRRRRRGGRDRDEPDSGEPDGGLDIDEDPDFDSESLPGEPPGVWMGNACGFYGVSGAIIGKAAEDDFLLMCEGFHPNKKDENGEKIPLVQNAGRMTGERKRTVGWDLTFSAPKSLSVYFSASPK